MREILNGIITVVSAVYILFLPGFVLSFVFFRHRTIDIIERLALSFALSIAVVPLVAFYLNLVGVRLSRLSVLLEVLGVLVISGIIIKLRSKRKPGVKEPLAHIKPPTPANAAPGPPQGNRKTPATRPHPKPKRLQL